MKKRWRKGKNKTKERRNPPKMSLHVGAKFIFLGGGYILIHMHINIYACENMMKKIHLISSLFYSESAKSLVCGFPVNSLPIQQETLLKKCFIFSPIFSPNTLGIYNVRDWIRTHYSWPDISASLWSDWDYAWRRWCFRRKCVWGRRCTGWEGGPPAPLLSQPARKDIYILWYN